MEKELTTEIAILCILCVTIVIGNVFVVFIFGNGKRKLTDYLLVNLAVADFLVGAVVIPLWISLRTGLLTTTSAAFRVFSVFDIAMGSESVFSLALVSIERMIAIQFPFCYRTINALPVLLAILVSWILAIGIGLYPNLVGRPTWYQYLLITSVFVLPLLITVTCYAIIFRAVRRSPAMNVHNTKKNLKTARVILIIVGLFMITWLPFFAVSTSYILCTNWCNTIPAQLVIPFKILHYSNSVMNVFVYAASMPAFRRGIKEIVTKFCPCGKTATPSNNKVNKPLAITSRGNQTKMAVLSYRDQEYVTDLSYIDSNSKTPSSQISSQSQGAQGYIIGELNDGLERE